MTSQTDQPSRVNASAFHQRAGDRARPVIGVVCLFLVGTFSLPELPESREDASVVASAEAGDLLTEVTVSEFFEEICIVATLEDETVTIGDVRRLRAALEPPPPWPEATRLAVDVWLASAGDGLSTTADESVSPQARLARYRALHTDAHRRSHSAREALEDVRATLVARALEKHLAFGPCHMPRSRPENDRS